MARTEGDCHPRGIRDTGLRTEGPGTWVQPHNQA